MGFRRGLATGILAAALAACAAEPDKLPPPARAPLGLAQRSLPLLPGRTAMEIQLTLSPAPLESLPEIGWVQIAEGPSGPSLLRSIHRPIPPMAMPATQVFASALAGGPSAPVVTDREMLPAGLRWDATRRADGRFVVAVEHALGATNAIMLVSPDDPGPLDPAEFLGRTPSPSAVARAEAAALEGWISPPRSFDTFNQPRFVRGAGADRLSITAIMNQRGPVVFTGVESPSKKPSPQQRIEVPCVDAVMLVDRYGPSLVYKVRARGPANDDEVLSGRLHYLRLRDDLRPAGAPIEVFPGLVVFEIDAAPLADGVAVMATTRTGVAVSLISSNPSGPSVLAVKEHALEGHVISPSILGAGQAIHLAALVAPRTPQAKVLVGTLGFAGGRP